MEAWVLAGVGPRTWGAQWSLFLEEADELQCRTSQGSRRLGHGEGHRSSSGGRLPDGGGLGWGLGAPGALDTHIQDWQLLPSTWVLQRSRRCSWASHLMCATFPSLVWGGGRQPKSPAHLTPVSAGLAASGRAKETLSPPRRQLRRGRNSRAPQDSSHRANCAFLSGLLDTTNRIGRYSAGSLLGRKECS